jgi:trimethylguanosine synthase
MDRGQFLFSRFAEGVKMDKNGWSEVTPEVLAEYTAETIVHRLSVQAKNRNRNGFVVLDGFGGLGGNAIQFALHPQIAKVISVELNPRRLQYAQHNAQIYGVQDKITFILGNVMEVMQQMIDGQYEDDSVTAADIDVVYLAPPWGGKTYSQMDTFDPQYLGDLDGREMVATARALSPNVVLLLPRNLDIAALRSMCHDARLQCEVHFIDRHPTAISVYLDDMVLL